MPNMAAAMAAVSDQRRNCSPGIDVSSSVRRKYLKRKHQKYRKSKRRRKARKEMAVAPSPFGERVHSSWFWQNYHNVMEWQGRHQVAYWRSRTVALEQENCLLHEYIRSLTVGDEPKYRNNFMVTSEHSRQPILKVAHRKDEIADNSEEDDERESFSVDDEEDEEEDKSKADENFEFEITEDLLNFFEQSIRHKMELKKQREEEENLSQDEKRDGESSLLPPVKQVGQQRQEDMKLLYGKAAPMIVGMETALQLSFDRNCDLKQPKLWPNIPLKL